MTAVFRKAAATASVRCGIIGVQFLTQVLMARALGPEARGEYFFVWTLATLVSQFGNLGMQSGQTYLVAHDESLLSRLTANSVWLSLSVGSVLGLLGTLVVSRGGWAPGADPLQLALSILIAPLLLCFLLLSNLMAGVQRLRLFNVFQAAQASILLISLLVAWQLKPSATYSLWAAVIAYTIVNVGGAWSLLQPGTALRFDSELFARSWAVSMRAYVVCALGFLVLRAPVFFLRSDFDDATVGYYSVAAQISDVLTLLPQTVALILFPALVKSGDADRWGATLSHLKPVALVQTALVAVAFAGAPYFVGLVFGEDFLVAADVLRWMLPGAMSLGLASVMGQYFAARGFPRLIIAIWGSVSVVSVATSWIAIRSWGLVGAAVSYSLPHVVLLFLVYVMGTREESVGVRRAG